MSDAKVYSIEVQGDFLTKQTYAKPAQALAELIWNSLDADATLVEVKEDTYGVGEQRIIVADNGTGFSHLDAPGLFSHLGGSWKHQTGETKDKHRFLHGSEGKGRLKAFSLGRVVDWEVCSREGNEFKQFSVSMIENALREVRITDPQPAKVNRTGVRCVISELHKAYEFLHSEHTLQELSELFATYLKNYTDVQIVLPSGKLDIAVAVASNKVVPLGTVTEDGIEYAFELEIIEWKNPTDRVVYLCNEAGFPLSQSEVRVQVPGLNFSAYVKSPYISKLSRDGTLALAEMTPVLEEVLEKVKESIKAFYRERGAEKAQTVVDRWKEEQVYPYAADPKNLVEQIEREVFDIVAIKVNNLLPDFDASPQKGKKLQLRMLRQAVEKSPEELQVILTEVLDLPEKKQKEFAKLLQETSLTAIISASKVVADRLKFIEGLDVLLFKEGEKENLKERTQLHRLLADNTWIFGEEFSLSVDDQSLTEVLRKHLIAKGVSAVVDEPVKRIDGKRGIVDLMLTRNIPCARENELEHLVIELKRPTVDIGAKEIEQVKSYAFAVAEDERFNGLDTRWTFWVISNGMDSYAKHEARQAGRPLGLIHQSDDKKTMIWIKSWSEVLQANRYRLKLFQEKLEFNADRDASLTFLRETYANVLGGGDIDEAAQVESEIGE
ncbi:MAG: ATP-binding protein [Rhodocyclaceae bacterium]|nr:ATP-binding protein [Rhodocyclaceae bacterium]